MAGLIATLLYLNFFAHHYIGDFRWYLAAAALGLYARATIVFRPWRTDRRMPLPLGLVLVGFFIWLAENIGTFFGLWAYPHQLGAWAAVHVAKWSAWSLLVLMSFTIVTNLKHVKATVHVPEQRPRERSSVAHVGGLGASASAEPDEATRFGTP